MAQTEVVIFQVLGFQTDYHLRSSYYVGRDQNFLCEAGVRLRWVWHRYSSVGLPIMHVLVVTHLCSCVRLEIAALFLSCTMDDWAGSSCLALKALVSHSRHASQVIPIRSQYLCPGNYRPYQGYSRQYHYTSPPWWAVYAEIWEIRGSPDSTNL